MDEDIDLDMLNQLGKPVYHSSAPVTNAEIMTNIRIISSVEQCYEVVAFLMENFRLIAVDIRGCYIASGGKVSILLVASSDGGILMFDLYTCENMMHEGRLRELLEHRDVVKVIHDSLTFMGIMRTVYNVRPKNIFDTQVAYKLIVSLNRNYPLDTIPNEPLSTIVYLYGREMTTTSENDFCTLLGQNPYVWEYRPLDLRACVMGARNVTCLVPEVYVNMVNVIPKKCYKILSVLMDYDCLVQKTNQQKTTLNNKLTVLNNQLADVRAANFREKIEPVIEDILREKVNALKTGSLNPVNSFRAKAENPPAYRRRLPELATPAPRVTPRPRTSPVSDLSYDGRCSALEFGSKLPVNSSRKVSFRLPPDFPIRCHPRMSEDKDSYSGYPHERTPEQPNLHRSDSLCTILRNLCVCGRQPNLLADDVCNAPRNVCVCGRSRC